MYTPTMTEMAKDFSIFGCKRFTRHVVVSNERHEKGQSMTMMHSKRLAQAETKSGKALGLDTYLGL